MYVCVHACMCRYMYGNVCEWVGVSRWGSTECMNKSIEDGEEMRHLYSEQRELGRVTQR